MPTSPFILQIVLLLAQTISATHALFHYQLPFVRSQYTSGFNTEQVTSNFRKAQYAQGQQYQKSSRWALYRYIFHCNQHFGYITACVTHTVRKQIFTLELITKLLHPLRAGPHWFIFKKLRTYQNTNVRLYASTKCFSSSFMSSSCYRLLK